MLPSSKTPRSAAPEAKKGLIPAPAALASSGRAGDGPDQPLAPIGPERLKALREAIRSGQYPSDADVVGGLERMLHGGGRRR